MIAIAFLFFLQVYSGSIEGTVVSAATNKPIPGADYGYKNNSRRGTASPSKFDQGQPTAFYMLELLSPIATDRASAGYGQSYQLKD